MECLDLLQGNRIAQLVGATPDHLKPLGSKTYTNIASYWTVDRSNAGT